MQECCDARTLTKSQNFRRSPTILLYVCPGGPKDEKGVNLRGRIEMIVRDAERDLLRYSFANLGEASEMMMFLKDFFENVSFVIQQQRH